MAAGGKRSQGRDRGAGAAGRCRHSASNPPPPRRHRVDAPAIAQPQVAAAAALPHAGWSIRGVADDQRRPAVTASRCSAHRTCPRLGHRTPTPLTHSARALAIGPHVSQPLHTRSYTRWRGGMDGLSGPSPPASDAEHVAGMKRRREPQTDEAMAGGEWPPDLNGGDEDEGGEGMGPAVTGRAATPPRPARPPAAKSRRVLPPGAADAADDTPLLAAALAAMEVAHQPATIHLTGDVRWYGGDDRPPASGVSAAPETATPFAPVLAPGWAAPRARPPPAPSAASHHPPAAAGPAVAPAAPWLAPASGFAPLSSSATGLGAAVSSFASERSSSYRSSRAFDQPLPPHMPSPTGSPTAIASAAGTAVAANGTEGGGVAGATGGDSAGPRRRAIVYSRLTGDRVAPGAARFGSTVTIEQLDDDAAMASGPGGRGSKTVVRSSGGVLHVFAMEDHDDDTVGSESSDSGDGTVVDGGADGGSGHAPVLRYATDAIRRHVSRLHRPAPPPRVLPPLGRGSGGGGLRAASSACCRSWPANTSGRSATDASPTVVASEIAVVLRRWH